MRKPCAICSGCRTKPGRLWIRICRTTLKHLRRVARPMFQRNDECLGLGELSRMERTRTDLLKTALLLIALAGLLTGLASVFRQEDRCGGHRVVRRGRPGAGGAGLSRSCAAFGGARSGSTSSRRCRCRQRLAFGETLAAAVVALMYSGGTFLESFAEGRARREMHDLLSRVPRTASRHRNGGLEDVPLDEIAPGDRLLIRQGDVVPVDGDGGIGHGLPRHLGADR